MSRRTQRNVGVIGLGIIGRRVADCLRHQRFATFVWNRTPRAFPNFVGSPTEIAELCDFIQIFVSNDEALTDVVQQMKRSLGAHHVVMAHSTVSPATMRATAEVVQRRGAQLLDAPFTGSKMAAEKGELVYYVGGDEAAFRRARPVLEASSKEIIEIGEIGQATTIKVATNMITAGIVQSAAEALALVHNAGVPLEKFAEAMAENGSNSGTLAMKLPKMMSGDFEPHFSVKHMLKDVEIAARMARAYGLTLPATEVARDSLEEEASAGHGDEDYSAVIRVFFPDGPPRKVEESAEEEEQDDLTSWAERAPNERREAEPSKTEDAEAPREEIESEVVARNGHADDRAAADEPSAEAETNGETNGEQSRVERGDEEEEEEATSAEEEPEMDETREEEAPAEAQPVVATATKSPQSEKDQDESAPRGFFSRLFGKSTDY